MGSHSVTKYSSKLSSVFISSSLISKSNTCALLSIRSLCTDLGSGMYFFCSDLAKKIRYACFIQIREPGRQTYHLIRIWAVLLPYFSAILTSFSSLSFSPMVKGEYCVKLISIHIVTKSAPYSLNKDIMFFAKLFDLSTSEVWCHLIAMINISL